MGSSLQSLWPLVSTFCNTIIIITVTGIRVTATCCTVLCLSYWFVVEVQYASLIISYLSIVIKDFVGPCIRPFCFSFGGLCSGYQEVPVCHYYIYYKIRRILVVPELICVHLVANIMWLAFRWIRSWPHGIRNTIWRSFATTNNTSWQARWKTKVCLLIVSLIALDNKTFSSFFMLYHSECMVVENFVKLLTVVSCSLHTCHEGDRNTCSLTVYKLKRRTIIVLFFWEQ